ncbi:hypothetical protein FACS1894109_17240 [Spirochaetia bacterium]|nr:hypothetical protein FACS1894109_17240 [Spirochaetia bacterium]
MKIFKVSVSAVMLLISLLLSACSKSPVDRSQIRSQSQVSPANPQPLDIYYFYEELCASCEASPEGSLAQFTAIAERALEEVRGAYPYTLHTINIYNSGSRSLFERICAEAALDTSRIELPILVSGARSYVGLSEIEDGLRELYLSSGETAFGLLYTAVFADPARPAFVYFYRLDCDECAATTPLIDAVAQSAFTAIRLNTRAPGNNRERIYAFFDAYNVPDDRRMVPIIFLHDTYLAGEDEIRSYFSTHTLP